MSQEQNSTLRDIQEVNLSYLMLAQRLLRENVAAGMLRLDVRKDVADKILELSPAQMFNLARSSSLLCSFRLNDAQMIEILNQDALGGTLQQAHATILLAQQPSHSTTA